MNEVCFLHSPWLTASCHVHLLRDHPVATALILKDGHSLSLAPPLIVARSTVFILEHATGTALLHSQLVLIYLVIFLFHIFII